MPTYYRQKRNKEKQVTSAKSRFLVRLITKIHRNSPGCSMGILNDRKVNACQTGNANFAMSQVRRTYERCGGMQ